MTTSTPEKQDGLKILNDAIVAIKKKIADYGGVFNIQMAVSEFINYCYCKLTLNLHNNILLLKAIKLLSCRFKRLYGTLRS